jgi:hypothetical protein
MKNLLIFWCSLFFSFSALAENQRLTLSFKADQSTFSANERVKIVNFLKEHKKENKYEFELISLPDPLKANLDAQRFKDLQAIFRQYGINIDTFVDAKIRFIAQDKQQLIIIRK